MQVPPTFLVVFEKYTSSPWITLTRFQTPNLGKFHLDKNLGLERLDFIVQRESKHPVVQRPLVGWCLLFQRILTTISPLVILALQKGQYKLSLPAQDEADKISDLKSTFGTYLESRQTRAHTHTQRKVCRKHLKSAWQGPATGFQIGLHMGKTHKVQHNNFLKIQILF